MGETRRYGGLDWFRIISAVLVITIHIGPSLGLGALSDFLSIGMVADGNTSAWLWISSADFLLTRIIARVAVPFFLMVSGFFLLPGIQEKDSSMGRLYRQIGYLAKLYLIAVILYLPVMIYSGYFKEEFSIGTLMKDILINGTFYHLWYLPAAITGLFLVGLLLHYGKDWMVLIISLVLYLLGLLGDSYYGITAMVPWLKALYDGIFSISEYTRNGLFFVPVFLTLGYYLGKQADRRSGMPKKQAALGLTVSGILMCGEGIGLYCLNWQRHDSMYIMLPVVMVFLFTLMLQWDVKGEKRLNQIAMIVYIIHPAMIIVIRFVGKITRLTGILVGLRWIHFILVTVCSFAAAYMLTLIPARRLKQNRPDESK